MSGGLLGEIVGAPDRDVMPGDVGVVSVDEHDEAEFLAEVAEREVARVALRRRDIEHGSWAEIRIEGLIEREAGTIEANMDAWRQRWADARPLLLEGALLGRLEAFGPVLGERTRQAQELDRTGDGGLLDQLVEAALARANGGAPRLDAGFDVLPAGMSARLAAQALPGFDARSNGKERGAAPRKRSAKDSHASPKRFPGSGDHSTPKRLHGADDHAAPKRGRGTNDYAAPKRAPGADDHRSPKRQHGAGNHAAPKGQRDDGEQGQAKRGGGKRPEPVPELGVAGAEGVREWRFFRSSGHDAGPGFWLKNQALSRVASDRSGRVRVSFGVEGDDDASHDEALQLRCAELARAVFPETALLRDDPALFELLEALDDPLGEDRADGRELYLTQDIAYWNAPNGGALMHHDAFEEDYAERQRAVVYAQLTGATAWIALSTQDLAARVVEFCEALADGEMPWVKSSLFRGRSGEAALNKILRGGRFVYAELEKPGCGRLGRLVNRGPEFTSLLADAGHAFLVRAGDVVVLPNHGLGHTTLHSVFCASETPAYSISLALRRTGRAPDDDLDDASDEVFGTGPDTGPDTDPGTDPATGPGNGLRA